MSTTLEYKDLTKEAPRSPRERVGGYILLGRAIDKGRATLAGRTASTISTVHWTTTSSATRKEGQRRQSPPREGRDGRGRVAWLNANGATKTAEDRGIRQERRGYRVPTMTRERDWFVGEATKSGLDPAKVTLFDWLEVDDKQATRANRSYSSFCRKSPGKLEPRARFDRAEPARQAEPKKRRKQMAGRCVEMAPGRRLPSLFRFRWA